MRVAPPIALEEATRKQLQQQARRRSVPVRVAVRSRIVLLAADGLQNVQIGAELKISGRMAALWRDRFLTLGLQGLLKDAPRAGGTSAIASANVEQVVAKTTQTTPSNATHWSTRIMAREVGISEASVRVSGVRMDSSRIGLSPSTSATTRTSHQAEDIVGLYLNPREHALVLSVDEKSQMQALDRTQPGLAMKKGARPDHDPRLPAQRNHNSVRCVYHHHRRGLRPVPAAPSPSGVVEVPARD